VVLTRDDVIGRGDLPITVQESEAIDDDKDEINLTIAVERLERRMIREALARFEGVQTRAAERLGISERALRYKLTKYGFREEAADSDADPQAKSPEESSDPQD
jgi:two-component system NtrC family response regulator